MKKPTLLLAIASVAASANAANITWDPSATAGLQGGAGTWDNTTTNWTTDGGTTNVAWDNTLNAADTVVFGTAIGNVTLANQINLAGLTFTVGGNPSGYLISGGSLNFGSGLGSISTTTISDANNNSTTISSALVGTGGLTIASNGNETASGGSSNSRLIISGDNTGLSGGIAITDGLVEFANSSAAGSASTTAGSGNKLTLSNGGGLQAPATALTLGNDIELSTGGGTFRAFGGRTMTLNGVISGSGGFNKTDSGTFILTNENTYTGNTGILAGVLQVNNAGALGTTGTITFGTSGTGGTLQHTAANTVDYSSRFATVANQQFRINTNGQNITWASGLTSSGGTLTKTGTGTLTLSGTNGYTGTTTVSTGTLLVNGSNTGTGITSVASGATLGGTGSIAGAVNVTGTLAPGASIESLATGALAFATGSTLAYELNSTALNGDLLVVNGALDLTGTITLNLNDLAAGTLAAGSKLTLINYTGAWNGGIFNGYADDSTFTAGANQWLINYNDTTGGTNFAGEQTGSNFVTLTVVPEPSIALLGGLGMLGLLRRRRN